MLYKKPDLEASFVKFCVDDGGELPAFVRGVPTILVYDEQKRKQVLYGTPAFKWLKDQFERMAGDFTAMDSLGMGTSLSEQFSFLTDDGSNASNRTPMAGGYASIHNMGKMTMDTPQQSSAPGAMTGGGGMGGGGMSGGGMGSGRRLTRRAAAAEAQNNALQRYVNQRQNDIPGLKRDRPSEIDFTKPVSRQAPPPSNSVATTARRQDRSARITQSHNGIDFESPNFRAGARNTDARNPASRNPAARNPRNPPNNRRPALGRKLPPGRRVQQRPQPRRIGAQGPQGRKIPAGYRRR